MNILTEKVAIEGKNIIKDFQLGDTKTRVLKNISLKVIQGELFPSWDSPALEKVRCFIFSEGLMYLKAALSL